jgi:hypothetical protein
VGYATSMWLTFGTSLAAVAGALTGVVNAWLFLVRLSG